MAIKFTLNVNGEGGRGGGGKKEKLLSLKEGMRPKKGMRVGLGCNSFLCSRSAQNNNNNNKNPHIV